jgi:3'-phosphoadenosine 5'-phosphosulfate sulfotransferase (PAPS reductase)/FAD synthetase
MIPPLPIPDHVKNLAISFSGGQTSACMTKGLIDQYRGEKNIVVIFANTGQENEETLEFVNECDRRWDLNVVWVEAVFSPKYRVGTKHKIVSFETATRDGVLFEAGVQKYGLPNMSFPWCSRELKGATLVSIQKDLFHKQKYWTAIGIRADEFDRASVDAETNRILYPLLDAGVTHDDIKHFWSQQDFRLNLKDYQGNCKWCWKKTGRKLLTIAKETPTAFDVPLELEARYGDYRPENQPNRTIPSTIFRQHATAAQILERSKQPFEPWQDQSRSFSIFGNQTSLDFDLDVSSGCEGSCEAF